MKRNSLILALIIAAVAIVVVSCDRNEGDRPSTGLGNVVVSITDGPFPFDSVTNVFVNIDKVELRIAGGLCKTVNNEPVGAFGKFRNPKWHDFSSFYCDSGFVIVTEKAAKIDILKLQNGVTQALAEAVIPAGKYDIVRLHLVDATVVTKTNSYPVPLSEWNKYLKIRLDTVLVVAEGESTAQVLVDLDLGHSFIPVCHPSGKRLLGFAFNPVVRAVNHFNTGSIEGKVYEVSKTDTVAVSFALVSVYRNDTVFAASVSNTKGYYKIIGLRAGTYTLKTEKAGYTTKLIPGIPVVAKKPTKTNVQLIKQ